MHAREQADELLLALIRDETLWIATLQQKRLDRVRQKKSTCCLNMRIMRAARRIGKMRKHFFGSCC